MFYTYMYMYMYLHIFVNRSPQKHVLYNVCTVPIYLYRNFMSKYTQTAGQCNRGQKNRRTRVSLTNWHCIILCKVRCYLSFKAPIMLANVLVSSRGLCIILCAGWSAGCLVSNSMQSCHWLPIRFRINFEILLTVYKTLQCGHYVGNKNISKNSFTHM